MERETKSGWVASLSQFVAWMVASALMLVDMLFVREAALSLLAWFRVVSTEAYHRNGGVGEDIFTGFGISAADNALLLIMGIVVVTMVILVENYFRKGKAKGLLYRRIGKVFLIEIIIIAAAILIQQLVSTII